VKSDKLLPTICWAVFRCSSVLCC